MSRHVNLDFMHRFKLRTQMVLFVCLVVVLLSVQGAYNLWATQKVALGGQEIYEANLVTGVQPVLQAESAFLSVAVALNQHLNTTTPDQWTAVEQTMAEQAKLFGEHLGRIGVGTDLERRLVAETREAFASYQGHIPELVRLDRAGKAREAMTSVVPLMRSARATITKSLAQLEQFNLEEARAQNKANLALSATVFRNTVASIILVALLYLVMAVVFPVVITAPLREIQGVMDGVAAGDLSQNLSIRGTNELASLSGVINRTIAGLRTLVGQIARTAEQVAASSEELSASASQVGQVTQQVATTINQLAQGADEQAKQAQETGGVVADMSSAIQQVYASAQKMADDATGVAKAADRGRQAIGQAIGQMTAIRTTVDQSAGAVKGLGDRSREIGQIVEVITGIADQTNLLALNAAIEAARAGEQGRGFAVVAEEVRKLAEQSREAAERISGLIREIQGETGKAVESMSAGTHEVAAGAEVVSGAGEAFGAIVSAVETVVAQIQQVTAATRQLSTGSERVVRAVESIAAITEESAAGAEEVSASSEEQSASVEEIATSAASLARLAQDLQKTVATFRL